MAAPVDPKSVTGLQAWYSARASDVTLVSSKVSQWNDRSGNGRHVVQATDANRPTWESDAGDGRPAVQCTGGSQNLSWLGQVFQLSQPFTIIAMISGEADSMATSVNKAALGNGRILIRHSVSNISFQLLGDGGQNNENARFTTARTSFHTALLRRSSTTVRMRLDIDTADVSINPIVGTFADPDILCLCALSQNGGFIGFQGRVREALYYNREITDLEWEGILAFLAAPEADVTVPTIGNFSPALGSSITRSTPLSFDVTDESAFRRIVVAASFGTSNAAELIHDGSIFRDPYAGGSSRVAIAGGFRYSISRIGGWPDWPTFDIYPIDIKGNEGL